MTESLIERLRDVIADPSLTFTDSRRALMGTASHLLELHLQEIVDINKDFNDLMGEVERRNDALKAIAAQLSLADDTPMQELVDTALRVIDEGLQKILNDQRPVDLG